MTEKGNSATPPGSGFVGVALIALCTVGLASAFFAFMAINKSQPDFAGVGLLLIASAISFGQLLSALLRK